MSHPQEPTRQPTPKEASQYATTVHNVAIATLIVCPVLALLPPRKLDTYTIGLVGMTAFSVNYLHRETYGQTIWQRFVSKGSIETDNSKPNDGLPTERAREFQRQLREQQAAKLRQEGKVVDQTEKAKQGILEQLWMGDETEGWKQKREKEVEAALADGKGYGDIIMDQIWEVWNWGKKNEDESTTNNEK